MDDRRNFRVIIVGGGVAGLAAAHALQKAKIDHIVLEKGVIAPVLGASIGIYPHGSRILQQFGVLKAVNDETYPVGKAKDLLPDGTVYAESDTFQYLREYFGYPIPVLERRKFLEIMYNGLEDKSVIRTGVEVVDIIDSTDSVQVVLADGTVEEGDLVLGVDGVHSRVRSLMWRNANTAIPGMITTAEKKTLHTDYQLLLGFSNTKPEMSNSELTATHYSGKSFLTIGGKNHTFWFVFFKQDRKHWPDLTRYTQADAEKRASEILDCPISETQCFGEVWRTAIRYELVNVEEGLFQHMFFGRVVLAGDSAHKMTPNIGLGGNSGMESVVALTNLLNQAVDSHPQKKPDYQAIQRLLTEYQSERQQRMRKIIDFSGLATKLQAWETPFHKIISRVVPFLPDDTFAKQASALFKGAPKLDFIPVPGDIRGSMQWDDEVSTTALTTPAPSLLGVGKSTSKLLTSITAPFLLVVAILLPLVLLLHGAIQPKLVEMTSR